MDIAQFICGAETVEEEKGDDRKRLGPVSAQAAQNKNPSPPLHLVLNLSCLFRPCNESRHR